MTDQIIILNGFEFSDIGKEIQSNQNVKYFCFLFNFSGYGIYVDDKKIKESKSNTFTILEPASFEYHRQNLNLDCSRRNYAVFVSSEYFSFWTQYHLHFMFSILSKRLNFSVEIDSIKYSECEMLIGVIRSIIETESFSATDTARLENSMSVLFRKIYAPCKSRLLQTSLTSKARANLEIIFLLFELIDRRFNYLEPDLDIACKLFTVNDFAIELNVHTKILDQIVKEYTGNRTNYYLDIVSLNTAKAMLNETDLSIKEISYFLGYSHAGHFSRAFKNKFGLNPASFRSMEAA